MRHNESIISEKNGLVLPDFELRKAVYEICDIDPDFRKIEFEAGILTIRHWPPGFSSLVRIILGQQLSTKAAWAIFQRLNQLLDLTPTHIANCSDLLLKQVGLSQAKIITCKRLAEMILEDRLILDELVLLPNILIAEKLTQVKGIGAWTAEIYLLFCLERLNSFPASDLAIQKSYQVLKKFENRPNNKELLILIQQLEPYRGVAAHMLWHYYRFLMN